MALLLLGLQGIKGGNQALTNIGRVNHFVDHAHGGGNVGVHQLFFVLGDALGASSSRIRSRSDFLLVDDFHGTFGTHHGHLGNREGEHVVGTHVLAVHGDVGAAESLTQNERHLRHGGFGKGIKQLCTVADNARVFLLGARHVARNVGEGEERNVERVAETHKAASLVGTVHVQGTGEHLRLVSHDTDRFAVQAGKADHHILAPVALHFKEAVGIGKGGNNGLHVVSLLVVIRNDVLDRGAVVEGSCHFVRFGLGEQLLEEAFVVLGGFGNLAVAFGRFLAVALRQVAEELADTFEALLVVFVHEVSHTGLGGMHRSATEVSSGNAFTNHLLHHSRARQEHLARVLRHENEVAQSRRIAGATSAGAHDHGNLRNHA